MAALRARFKSQVSSTIDRANLSSSKSIVQSLLVGFVMSREGGCKGTYTGFPPLNVMDGRYWSKKGSNMMTSSPCSRNAVNTEYCPARHGGSMADHPGYTEYLLAFVSPAGDKDLRFDIEVPVELGSIELFDCLAQTRAPFGVRVVVCSYGIQSLRRRVGDPFRRRKIHVPLAEIKAICGQVGGTTSRQSPVNREKRVRLT